MMLQYVHALWEKFILQEAYKSLLPLAVVTILLLINRFIQRSMMDIHLALENVISIGVIFSSGIWLLLMPLIYQGFKHYHLKSISRAKFVLYHLCIATVIGLTQSYVFVYMHNLIWPEVLNPMVALSPAYLLEDFRLNFFIYWAVIGGYYFLNLPSGIKNRILKIKSNSHFINIPVEHIVRIKALGNYVSITESKDIGWKTHIVRYSMQQISRQLTTLEFHRVQRSYIINRDFIKEYKKGSHGEFVLTLATGEIISTSRSQKKELATWLEAMR